VPTGHTIPRDSEKKSLWGGLLARKRPASFGSGPVCLLFRQSRESNAWLAGCHYFTGFILWNLLGVIMGEYFFDSEHGQKQIGKASHQLNKTDLATVEMSCCVILTGFHFAQRC